jgi:hypothetical protein
MIVLASDDQDNVIWTRCGRGPIEVHHALKRSRGGHLLDAYTDYHLIAVCHMHHRQAEEENDWDAGLILPGYVITDSITGRPVYTGPDEYLSKEFGA